MRTHNEENEKSGSFLLFFLGFLLFLEWLRPLTEITETGHLGLFMMFTAYTFFLSYMRLPAIIAFPVKIAMVLYVIHVLFYSGPFFELSWITNFFSEIMKNLLLCIQLNFVELTSEFRTFLFLIVLWLVSYLMYYWLIHLRKITLFFILTIIFIGVVDTFTFYKGESAIFRAISIGFILLGVLHILRVKEREKITIKTNKIIKSWVTMLAIILFISTSVAHLLPKYSPQWPDPIPYITSYSEDATGTIKPVVQKSGYGENDRRLGGPFTFDYTPLFTADIKEFHYWRIESKDKYTGKGWEVTGDTIYYEVPKEDVKYKLYDASTTTEKLSAQININDEVSFFYLLNPGQITSLQTAENIKAELQQNNGRFTFLKDGRKTSIQNYNVDYDFPKFSIKAMRYSELKYPEEIKRKYLQVPENLPDRVKQLAQDIVRGKNNPYDKAVAVERFFGNGDYIYDNNRVAVPGPEDDYVDQFLFDTKRGYCDNYSSSMAVLLRTLGIPTRWVKGFTQGKFDETLKDGVRRYKITNANAHSWVEVYFQGVGWVPFEPTRGFNNVYDFINDDESTNNGDEEETPELEKDNSQEQDLTDEPLIEDEDKNGGASAGQSEKFSAVDKWLIFMFIVLLAAIAFIIYRKRKHLVIKFMIMRFKNRKDDAAFYEAYRNLLFVLKLCGYERKDTETLRKYASFVDKRLMTDKLTKLTLLYEKGIYHKQSDTNVWSESIANWEEVLRKIQVRL